MVSVGDFILPETVVVPSCKHQGSLLTRLRSISGFLHFVDASASLLGRHVARRADDIAGGGKAAITIGEFRQTKIGDPRLTFIVEQDIGWLQVAVNDAASIHVFDGDRQLAQESSSEISSSGSI